MSSGDTAAVIRLRCSDVLSGSGQRIFSLLSPGTASLSSSQVLRSIMRTGISFRLLGFGDIVRKTAKQVTERPSCRLLAMCWPNMAMLALREHNKTGCLSPKRNDEWTWIRW